MKLKQIALATAAATLITPALSVASVAQSQPTHKQYTNAELVNRGIHPAIVQGFDALGVPVVDGKTLPKVCGTKTEGSYTMAVYNYRFNVVVVCTQHISNPDVFIKAITHEAAHMVQDCRTGIGTATLDPGPREYVGRLWNALPEKHRDTILKLYPQEHWDVETEAFYFQSKPAAVAQGIADLCF